MKTLLVSVFCALMLLLLLGSCINGNNLKKVEPIEITVNVTNCKLVDVLKTGECVKCDVDIVYNGVNQGTTEVYISIPKKALEEIKRRYQLDEAKRKRDNAERQIQQLQAQ